MDSIISGHNTIVYERLVSWIVEKSAVSHQAIEEKVYEWGDVQYLLQHKPDTDSIRLSLSMPVNDGDSRMDGSAWMAAYKGIATLLTPPLGGYLITLDLNVRMLSKLSQQQQQYCIMELASLRLHVTSSPLREHFQHLIEDRCSEEGPVETHFSGSRVFFIKPLKDEVCVCFPVHFSSSDDVAIGRTFLGQFTEARKKPALGKSPSCSYEQEVPLVLGTVDPSLLRDVNGGYVSFTFLKRHVNGPQMKRVLWSMCSFFIQLSCRLKSCKAKLHSSMESSLQAVADSLKT